MWGKGGWCLGASGGVPLGDMGGVPLDDMGGVPLDDITLLTLLLILLLTPCSGGSSCGSSTAAKLGGQGSISMSSVRSLAKTSLAASALAISSRISSGVDSRIRGSGGADTEAHGPHGEGVRFILGSEYCADLGSSAPGVYTCGMGEGACRDVSSVSP